MYRFLPGVDSGTAARGVRLVGFGASVCGDVPCANGGGAQPAVGASALWQMLRRWRSSSRTPDAKYATGHIMLRTGRLC